VLLENKTAVVYGGGGSIGGAVARAFAREGARVFLAGRTSSTLEAVADEIRSAGGEVEAAQVDALDEKAVDDHANEIAQRTGAIDVSFNAIGDPDTHGTPVLQMMYEEYEAPIVNALRAQFLIARAAARHMAARGSGVILAVTATTARQAVPEVGATWVRFDSTESLCRQLASELGPSGIRVVTLRTTGIPRVPPDTSYTFPDYGTGSGGMTFEELLVWLKEKPMLKRLTTLSEVANVAAFVASDRASAVTGSVVNVNCGSVLE
jgi:NAD(P)-dependent dehydrogenase (short-subunit alcohol dehydrogenase family)